VEVGRVDEATAGIQLGPDQGGLSRNVAIIFVYSQELGHLDGSATSPFTFGRNGGRGRTGRDLFRLSRIIGYVKAILVLLVSAGFAMTVTAASDTDPATKLVVAFTGNRWTTDKRLIATGTLTNTNSMPVTITRIIATGFDKQQNVVTGGPGAPDEAVYTIGDPEIAAGATAIFKVALNDPKKAIRFVKATPLIEPIPTPTPIPTATPTPIPTPVETASERLAHPASAEPARATVKQLALAAWYKDKMLPGNDGKYNWFDIGLHQADWKEFFHSKGLLRPADDEAFGDAFSAIAHESEERLRERAFENNQ
jgi:hypothetical protein